MATNGDVTMAASSARLTRTTKNAHSTSSTSATLLLVPLWRWLERALPRLAVRRTGGRCRSTSTSNATCWLVAETWMLLLWLRCIVVVLVGRGSTSSYRGQVSTARGADHSWWLLLLLTSSADAFPEWRGGRLLA